MKPRLKVSFSGGATSGMMAKLCKDRLSDKYEIVFVFANTGEEDERTLQFVNRCDQEWGLGVAWVEAVVNPVFGQGTTHRVVTFETASRHGEPFEEVIKVYGIPNQYFEPCNRELKLNAMNSYMRSIGWTNYKTAIGIRMDETRRVNPVTAEKARVIYPLIDIWPRDKQDVRDFWEDQPFRLGLEEHEGNCKTCWKKSDKKHFRLIAEQPESYEFNRRMEALYGWHGAPHYGTPSSDGVKRVFFRARRSVDDMFAQARELGYKPSIPVKEVRSHEARQFNLDFDVGGCGESCELYPTEVPA
jgi:hypothetical protein